MSTLVASNEHPAIEMSSERGAGGELFDVVVAATQLHMTTPEAGRVTELVAGVPLSLIESYADLAVLHAGMKRLEGKTWFLSIKELPGAWGEGDDRISALADLREAVIGWASIQLEAGHHVPVIGGLDVNPRRRESAA